MTDDGGPAYPTLVPPMLLRDGDGPPTVVEGSQFQIPGMSLRDYFAGQAMVGTCIAHVLVIVNSGKIPPQLSSDAASRANYEIADAMLAERKKCPPHPA